MRGREPLLRAGSPGGATGREARSGPSRGDGGLCAVGVELWRLCVRQRSLSEGDWGTFEARVPPPPSKRGFPLCT